MRTTSQRREGYSWSLHDHRTQRRSPNLRSIAQKSPGPKQRLPAKRSPVIADLIYLAIQGKERMEERSPSLATPSTKQLNI